MAQIYLTGAVSDWDDPFRWHDELQDSDEWSDHEFVNPYTLNDFDVPVMSVDVPTGFDCDTGQPQGDAVRADRTVTFVLNKQGYAREGADEWTGRVEVAEISVPRALIERKVQEWKAAETP